MSDLEVNIVVAGEKGCGKSSFIDLLALPAEEFKGDYFCHRRGIFDTPIDSILVNFFEVSSKRELVNLANRLHHEFSLIVLLDKTTGNFSLENWCEYGKVTVCVNKWDVNNGISTVGYYQISCKDRDLNILNILEFTLDEIPTVKSGKIIPAILPYRRDAKICEKYKQSIIYKNSEALNDADKLLAIFFENEQIREESENKEVFDIVKSYTKNTENIFCIPNRNVLKKLKTLLQKYKLTTAKHDWGDEIYEDHYSIIKNYE